MSWMLLSKNNLKVSHINQVNANSYVRLDDDWLTTNEQFVRFRKARENILGRVKGAESPYAQGTQYYEE